MSFDRLQDQIIEKKNPTVLGLDPRIEYVPKHIQEMCYARFGRNLQGTVEAIYQFNCGLMDGLADLVPAVKPQAAYYEMLGWRGMEMMERTIRYAGNKGFYVIADIKRGDIGSTAQAYAEGWLGKTGTAAGEEEMFGADCVTLNGYMGVDSITPFMEVAVKEKKSLFLLVKTSNPSGKDLQDMKIDGKTVYQIMGDLTEKWGAGTAGKYGYQVIGAVVGATYPEEMKQLRRRLNKTFFLVPGYGAQGGTAEDVRYAFDACGRGAIVNASRSLMCAWKKTGGDGRDYQEASRAAAIAMRDDICRFVTIE